MYLLDSVHVWHVAKTGNDGNGGHAQQYPINLAADAKLTLSAAIAAAAAGDTIIVHPGLYSETVDLSKQLILEGTNRDQCRITSALNALTVSADGGIVRRMHATSTGATTQQGIRLSDGINDVVLEDCYGEGNWDGIYLATNNNVRLIRCYGKSGTDGIQLGGGRGVIVEQCIGESTGAYVSNPSYGFASQASLTGAIIKDCIAISLRSRTDDKDAGGIKCAGQMLIDGLVSYSNQSAGSGDGDAIGMRIFSGAQVLARNVVIKTISANGEERDIQVDDGLLNIIDSVYDTAKTTGTFIQGGSGWAAAVNAEIDTALDSTVPGSPTADSINERIKAIDDKLPSATYLRGTADSDGGLCAADKSDINAEADTALSDIRLDHLLAVADDDDPVDDSIIAKMAGAGNWSSFEAANDSLMMIRDYQQVECKNALQSYELDHLISASGGTITNDSILAKLVSKSATAAWSDFVNTTDSLQAIRDKEDALTTCRQIEHDSTVIIRDST